MLVCQKVSLFTSFTLILVPFQLYLDSFYLWSWNSCRKPGVIQQVEVYLLRASEFTSGFVSLNL